MIPIIYVTLLIFMLFVLYRCGQQIAKTGSIKSNSALFAILIYTLNEGLRFGRGVDYNGGWIAYEYISSGVDYPENVGFLYLEEVLIFLGLPWQACVILMSFAFIFGLMFFLRLYKEVIPYALPMFVLFSNLNVENMARWYFSYSIFLIGLYYLLSHKNNWISKYICYSIIASTIHYAFIPIPIMFWILSRLEKPIINPIVAIFMYFAIGLLFKTDMMLQFSDIFNTLSQMSDKFSIYGNDSENWLTGGRALSAFPSIGETMFLCTILWFGSHCVKSYGINYIYAYNILILGTLMRPIAYQIELLDRYCCVFFFFRAIVASCIIKHYFIDNSRRNKPFVRLFILVIFLNILRGYVKLPFVNNPKQFMYVWDHKNETPEKMKEMWANESDKYGKQFMK